MAQERINLILQHLCLSPSSLHSLLSLPPNNNNNNINNLFNITTEQQITELTECKGKEEIQTTTQPRKLIPKDFYNFQYKDYHDFRLEVMKHFEEEGYYLSPELQATNTLTDLRQFALEKVKKLQSQNYISVWDIKKEPKKFFAVIESYAGNQLGVALKFSLTYLFLGNSIIELGTEKHYHYLDSIDRGEIFGCFALAEIGHGSNIRALETTAVYDKSSQEFIIHSPTPSSYKSWIAGAGDHASHSVVFCQLFIDDQCFGLHPFIVQLRDRIGGNVKEGIVISDVGLKEGLNTLDNAYIQFIHHRIPRDGLLDRYGKVTEEGEYHSNTTVGERFIIQYSTFLPTKLFIGAQSISAMKTGLSISIRYAHKRRQFGVGEKEIQIINFNYTRLVPLMATSFALTSFYNTMKEMYERRNDCCKQKQQAYTFSLKVFSSWEAIEGLQICRECCGAQGYLVQNLISSLRSDIDAYVTIDGDNQTLLQQISRYLLDNLQRKFKKRGAEMEYMKDRMNYLLFEKHFQGRTADVASIMSAEFQLKAMKIREERIMFTLAGRLKKKLKKSSSFLDAWNKVLDHVHSLAISFIHRIVLKCFISDINHFDTTENTKYYLNLLRSLFALKIIENDPWFFTSGHLTPSHLILIRKQNAKICKLLKGNVLDLCDSFAVSKELLKRTIAKD